MTSTVINSSDILSKYEYPAPANINQPCPFNQFPQELVLTIFSSLNANSMVTLREVCQSFRWILDNSTSLICQRDHSSNEITEEIIDEKELLAWYAYYSDINQKSKDLNDITEEEKKKIFAKHYGATLSNPPSVLNQTPSLMVLAARKESRLAIKLLFKLKDSQGISIVTQNQINHAFIELINAENPDLLMLFLRKNRVGSSLKGFALGVALTSKHLELVNTIQSDPKSDLSVLKRIIDIPDSGFKTRNPAILKVLLTDSRVNSEKSKSKRRGSF